MTSAALAYRRALVPVSYYGVALVTLLCLGATLALRKRPSQVDAALLRVPLLTARSLPFAWAIFVSWSITGIILALIPAQLAVTGQQKASGLVVFVAIASGVIVQFGPDTRDPARSLRLGYALVASSLALLVVAVHWHATGVLFLACALSGFSSFGFTHRAGLTGTMLAYREQRARALSGYYLLGYLGFGLPCVAVGYLAQHSGLEFALIGYSLLIGACWGLSRLVSGVQQRRAAANSAPCCPARCTLASHTGPVTDRARRTELTRIA